MNAKINYLKKKASAKGKYLLMLMILPITFSCLDDEGPSSAYEPTAYVSFYNGTNESSDIQIEVDSTVYDRKSFDFGEFIDYWYFYTGERNFSFVDNDSDQSLLDTAVNLDVEKAYSFFLTESNDEYTTLFIEDSLETPVNGKALIRLVHLAADGPEVDLYQRNNEDAVLESLSFLEFTDFVNVDIGETDFILKASSDNQNELVRLNDIHLREGRIYTVVIRGKLGADSNSAEALRLQLIRNYPNY
ncbi:DUF4397 domain-containing protein [Cyclobacterium sp. 1_MG-2023]|uniref:DUF4397 domain-containing protein n=1 Tax=Cyclobacterium sp. 1_MG-2023 TaxID=3062681 RepID=UPI0026E40F4E|nr:DUF4397 domain-containing protein [Cyclobacterium sp. 1_MG-2023]MDO6439482.1 DUF4397 domain-containing protein [Cyclobacterium sp. 1_MG-2023]